MKSVTGMRQTDRTRRPGTVSKMLAPALAVIWLACDVTGGSAWAQAAATGEAQPAQPPAAQQDPWAIACQATAPGETACSLVQRQMLQNGTVVMQLEVSGLEEGRTPALRVVLPLGVDLGEGVAVSVDGLELAQLKYRACVQAGCIAGLSIGRLPETMAGGKVMTVRFAMATADGDKPREVKLDAPLTGVSKALGRVRNQPQP